MVSVNRPWEISHGANTMQQNKMINQIFQGSGEETKKVGQCNKVVYYKMSEISVVVPSYSLGRKKPYKVQENLK